MRFVSFYYQITFMVSFIRIGLFVVCFVVGLLCECVCVLGLSSESQSDVSFYRRRKMNKKIKKFLFNQLVLIQILTGIKNNENFFQIQ